MPNVCGPRPCARTHHKKGLVSHLPVSWGGQQIPFDQYTSTSQDNQPDNYVYILGLFYHLWSFLKIHHFPTIIGKWWDRWLSTIQCSGHFKLSFFVNSHRPFVLTFRFISATLNFFKLLVQFQLIGLLPQHWFYLFSEKLLNFPNDQLLELTKE